MHGNRESSYLAVMTVRILCLSQPQLQQLLFFLPILGLVGSLQWVIKLACAVNKATNLRAQVLGARNKTLREVRTALLQNWVALDCPLLKEHQESQQISGLYCLNVSDYCQQI